MRWIIGDVHGMLRCLKPLVAEVRRRDPDSDLIFVGDYVNRGPDSKAVIDLLLELPRAKFIRGNHDDIFDLVINGECFADNAAHGDRIGAFQWFMKYGLDATLMSYGCDFALLDRLSDRPSVDLLDKLATCIPDAHRTFINSLPAVHEEEDLFVIHGKWDPDELTESPGVARRLEMQPLRRHQLLWGRYTENEIARTKAWRRTGHFGHTPVSFYGATLLKQAPHRTLEMVPVRGKNIVLLDTAAALGVDGRLTAYCVEDRSIAQVDHFGKLL